MMLTMNPISHIERWGFVFALIPIRLSRFFQTCFLRDILNGAQPMPGLR